MAEEAQVNNNAQPSDKPSVPKFMPELPVNPASGDEKNVFTELFGKDMSQQVQSDLMKTVSNKQDQSSISFFGKKPSLTEVHTTEEPKPLQNRRPGRLVLQVALLLALLTGAYFYSQNSPEFELLGINSAKREVMAQSQVDKLISEIHVQNHLAAVLILDQYTAIADEYFYHISQSESSSLSQNKKTESAARAEKLRPILLEQLSSIQTHLKKPPTPNELDTSKKVIDELIEELKLKKGSVDDQALLQDIQDLESTKKFMQSKAFKTSITSLNTEKAEDSALEAIAMDYGKVNSSVNSVVNQIKGQRIAWSVYVEALESLTKKVDPLFNTELESNLHLKDIQFSSDGRVSVSGYSTTEDTKNFTLSSNLIDSYEESKWFTNVEDRSYSKTSSKAEEAYLANFRILMTLETQ